jgi:hypothetical protein
MSNPYPHLIREYAVIDEMEYDRLGKAGVRKLMADVEAKARAVAKRVGIKRIKVRAKRWDLDVLCGFTDYPMYLCGPDAPRIETAADVFKHVWHLNNPRARYECVLEDKALFDQKRREWLDGLVAQARAEGIDSLRETWAPNVIAMVKRRMR